MPPTTRSASSSPTRASHEYNISPERPPSAASLLGGRRSASPKLMSNSSVKTTYKVSRNQFTPRDSQLDYHRVLKEKTYEQFWGFFTAFWMVMFLYVVMTIYTNVSKSGLPLNLYLFNLFSKDFLRLMLVDASMVASTYIAFGLGQIVIKGWIPPSVCWIIQHVWQAGWFFTWISLCWYLEWPWVQSSFFSLHTMVMLMKIHSYVDTIRELHLKRQFVVVLKENIRTASDEERESMEKELEELEKDLVSAAGVRFPSQITLGNFTDYLIVPTLVYELSYPRTDKIRLDYLAFKTFSTFATFFILYVTVENYVIPVASEIYRSKLSFLDALMQLLVPFGILYLLIFFIIFECILNAFAELSCFADRHFYDDWWNCVTWDQFARRWNRPVHEFLLRHVYLESIRNDHGKQNATFLTFFLSACFHELAMVMITRKLRGYLFALQLSQLPLIYLMRVRFIRNYPILGNMIFWLGMLSGPPFLAVCYIFA